MPCKALSTRKEAGLRAAVLHASNPFEQRLIECALNMTVCVGGAAVDFAELMLRSYEVLQSNEILRTHQNRF